MQAVSIVWLILTVLSLQLVCMQETYDEGEYEYNHMEYPQNCSISEVIKGGRVSYTQAGVPGSWLTYHCEQGQYPSPVSYRLCGMDGEWSSMRLASGRKVSQASCKDVLCPGQVQLDKGEFWPRDQWLRPGQNQSFSCHEGYTMKGSAQRTCTLDGDWTGTTPLCSKQDDDCTDPGIPPGALRTSGRLRVGDKIQYRCQSGMDLLGSSERVCLEAREWSGSEPRCQAPFAFDSPSSVAQAMGGSFSGVMDVLSPEFKKKEKKVTFERVLRIADGRINIFILLDTSGSITAQQFEQARSATIALIRKLDSYQVQMRFHVTSYASTAIKIVSILDPWCDNADEVIKQLMEFDHKSHNSQTGTNLYDALHTVYEEMSFLKLNKKERTYFNQTQNVILIETDGFSNTGSSALAMLARIRVLLGYSPTSQEHSHEDLLDVYVFGVGEKVNKKELNDIASNKRDDRHLFILREVKTLGEVFNTMISDESVIMCGIAQEDVSSNSKAHTRPWHVNIITTGSRNEKCQGTIISEDWVLTAAHCFSNAGHKGLEEQKTTIEYGGGSVSAGNLFLHPLYDVMGLKHKNVKEFYDYDIALVKVQKSIPISQKARPICLPCTKPASHAMKMGPDSTCKQHWNALLPTEMTRAYFIHKETRKQTHIHTGSRRPDCVKHAERTLTQNTTVTLDEYVPDRFLCTGGTPSQMDASSTKGDSGGGLFLTKRMRNFQVGVVSWGTVDINKKPSDKEHARDFHINIFKLMPWLRQHLGTKLDFLPDE
ncbi:complement factor B [Hypomesus transpacificus]|uniref:complement factor B n=1 Tax=Hypomesus transpacificus TaxID=137520 RepID=UPI001F080FF5|nr:complement factor B [Hypomesus transpacificus]